MEITRLNFKLAEYCIDEKSRLSNDIIRMEKKKRKRKEEKLVKREERKKTEGIF